MAAFDADVDVIVEFGFGFGPLEVPTWTDVSTYVKSASWTRGRSSVQGGFPAGTGELYLDNVDGRFYPWNTAGAYSPNVTVGVPVRIRATHNAVTYPLFYGFAAAWSAVYPTNQEEMAQVTLVEAFTRLEGKKTSAAYSAQSTDARVDDLLDAAGWPAGLRDLQAGVAGVTSIVGDRSSILTLLRDTVEAEQGELFQAADGDLTFLNRVAASAAGSMSTFGPDGVELTYVDVTVVHDDDYLFNEAFVTGLDNNPSTASDPTSITDHGPVTYETVNLSIDGEPGRSNVAEWIVAKYKDIPPRITGLVMDPAGSPAALWPEVLGRELRDVVTVEVSYPGSSIQLVQDVAVELISHSFQVGDVWTVSYGCHPLSVLEQEEFWILGTSALDTTTRLA